MLKKMYEIKIVRVNRNIMGMPLACFFFYEDGVVSFGTLAFILNHFYSNQIGRTCAKTSRSSNVL